MFTRQNLLNLLRKPIFWTSSYQWSPLWLQTKIPPKKKNTKTLIPAPELDKGTPRQQPFHSGASFSCRALAQTSPIPEKNSGFVVAPSYRLRPHVSACLFLLFFGFWNPGIFGRDPPAPKRLSAAAAGCGTNQLAKLQKNYLPRMENARGSYMHLPNQQPAYCCDPAADSAPNLDLSRYSRLHLQLDRSFTNYCIILLTL